MPAHLMMPRAAYLLAAYVTPFDIGIMADSEVMLMIEPGPTLRFPERPVAKRGS